jgi:hypothetical protein
VKRVIRHQEVDGHKVAVVDVMVPPILELPRLPAVESLVAVGAFVDGVVAPVASGGNGDCGGRVLVPAAERGLAAWCAAVDLASGGGVGDLADGAGHRRVVVP